MSVMATKKRVNWAAFEAEYVTSNTSIEELAPKYDVHPANARMESAKREWTAKRQQFRERMLEQANKKKLTETVLEKIHFDMICEQGCDIAVAAILRAIVDYVNNNGGVIDSQEMVNMAKAMQAWQDIKYRSLGIAPPKQTIEQITVIAPSNQIEDAVFEAVKEITDGSD